MRVFWGGDQSAPTSIRGPVTPLDPVSLAVGLTAGGGGGGPYSELGAAGSWGYWRSALSARVELGRRTAIVARENRALMGLRS